MNGKTSDPLYFTTHASAIGNLLLVAGNSGLRYVRLLQKQDDVATHIAETTHAMPTHIPAFFSSTIAAIDAYLTSGIPLNIPVHFEGGTPLQRAVWLALGKIPYGETISYSTLAENVGFPRAIRAVASACAANPVPLAIPCHRVIAKDGTLGGFSLGGLEVKEHLLRLEKRNQRLAA